MLAGVKSTPIEAGVHSKAKLVIGVTAKHSEQFHDAPDATQPSVAAARGRLQSDPRRRFWRKKEHIA
jgi:hypothetical protein